MSILVVRHADAGDRHRSDGPDDLRPLNRRGRIQAEGLRTTLDGFTIGRVLSSPYLRCVQTVAPLAAACGLAVEPSDELAEGAGAAAVDLVAGLARLGGADVVLCSHGDVVGDVLDGLSRAGVGLPDELRLRKGSTWALAVEDGRIVGARYLDPPAS